MDSRKFFWTAVVAFIAVMGILFFYPVKHEPPKKVFYLEWDRNPNARYLLSVVSVRSDNRQEIIHEMQTNGTSACFELENAESIKGWIFFIIAQGSVFDSEPATTYYLKGNIVGDYSDGVPFKDAGVNGLDLEVLRGNFGKKVIHQLTSCQDTYVPGFKTKIPSIVQKCDLNKDGVVDKLDEAILIRYINKK